METFLIRALQLVLSLTLLVLVHEGGHFLFSRLFKVRVEKFYIFFNPWFTLFKYKPRKSDTEYGIGWLPLGGYCKISGMIDESMDVEQMKQPAQPWEFRSKPAWQRLLIMVGGVLFNFLLALFIYSMILFTWGDSYLLPKDMKMGMDYGEVAENIGFRDGDVLLRADGKELGRYPKMVREIAEAREVTVLRQGKESLVYMPEDLMQQLMAAKEGFAQPLIPYVVDSVLPETGAALAGLQRGDSIVGINGQVISSFNQYSAIIQNMQEGKASNMVSLAYVRNGAADTVAVALDSTYKAGMSYYGLTHYIPVHVEKYDFLASFPAGIQLGVNTLTGYVSDMKYVFTKEGANSLGGFGTIGSIFPPVWDWHAFWSMTAFLSVILAFMNILPIPALDGGHVLFLFYEIIARRKPSDKFMERAQMVGMFLLFGLLIWANFNDVLRMVFNVQL